MAPAAAGTDGPRCGRPRQPATPGLLSSPTATLARPRARYTSLTDAEFYRRKKSSIVIRHVSDDRIVAMVEIVSPAMGKEYEEFLTIERFDAMSEGVRPRPADAAMGGIGA